MKSLTANALALLLALVLLGVCTLALAGVDVPAVLEQIGYLLAGAAAGAQVPRRARA